MLRLLSFALSISLLFQSASCFLPSPALATTKSSSTSSMSMTRSADNDDKKIAASFLMATYLFSNVISVAPAFAYPMDDFAGSSQVVAARSGGRMGGRSATGSRGSTPSYSKNTVRHTTIIQQSPSVIAAPSYGYGYSYGYDPTPGMGKSQFSFHFLP